MSTFKNLLFSTPFFFFFLLSLSVFAICWHIFLILRKHHSVGMQINKLLQPKNNLGRGDPNCLGRGDQNYLRFGDPNFLGRVDSNCLGPGDPNCLRRDDPKNLGWARLHPKFLGRL